MISKTVDLGPLRAALDEREWRIIQDYADPVATALETVVNRGATDEEIKRELRQYIYDDRVIRRIIPAARHVRRQGEAA